jgi:hypothetical protein
VVVAHRALAGDGLDDRDAVRLGEGGELALRQRVVHSPTGDEERRPRATDDLHRRPHLVDRRSGPGDRVHGRLEERSRVVEGLRLHVLWQAEEGRTAVGRVEHRGDRLRQRLHDLRRVGDAIPVAHDGSEGVVDRRRRRAEVLDLLQHRVGHTALERVAREQQQRQAVGHCHAGGRHHVERPRPDRRRRDHELAPAHRLGEAHRGERHALLVLPAPRRQRITGHLQGMAERGDVAVAEDGEHPRHERHLPPVDHRALGGEVADDRVGGGEADGGQRHLRAP